MGIWCLNTNNTKRLLPKMRVNLMKKRKKKWPKNLWKKAQNRNQKKKFTVFFLATGIMILKKTQRSTPPCLLFFSFAITRCFAKHFKYYYKYSLKLSIL